MAYVPINVSAYTAAYSGAIAGMALSGWITDPVRGNYAQVTQIAGAFAQAFDSVWNNTASLNALELQAITAIVQQEFAQRGPGPLANTQFTLASNWVKPAGACVAIVLQSDAYFAGQGITPPSSGGLISFNGRTTPAAVPTTNDYRATQVFNDSNRAGQQVSDALNGVWLGLADGSFIFNVGKGPNCYASITDAITAINILIGLGIIGISQRATIFLMPGQYVSTSPYLIPGRVGVKGMSRSTVQLVNATTNMFQCQGDNTWFEDFIIEGSANPNIYAFDLNNTSRTHIRNVDMLDNSGTATQRFVKQVGATWVTMFIEHCVVNTFQTSGFSVLLQNTAAAARFCDTEINDVFLDSYHLTGFGGGFLCRGVQDVRFRDCVIRGSQTFNTSIRLELAGVSGTPEVQIMSSLLFSGLPGSFAGVPLFNEAGTNINLYHSEAAGAVFSGSVTNHFSTVV